jgi:hypothetical protein
MLNRSGLSIVILTAASTLGLMAGVIASLS